MVFFLSGVCCVKRLALCWSRETQHLKHIHAHSSREEGLGPSTKLDVLRTAMLEILGSIISLDFADLTECQAAGLWASRDTLTCSWAQLPSSFRAQSEGARCAWTAPSGL